MLFGILAALFPGVAATFPWAAEVQFEAVAGAAEVVQQLREVEVHAEIV